MPTGIHDNHRGGRPRRIYADQKQKEELKELLANAIKTVNDAMHKKANSTQLHAAEIVIDRYFPKLKGVELSSDPDNPIWLKYANISNEEIDDRLRRMARDASGEGDAAGEESA